MKSIETLVEDIEEVLTNPHILSKLSLEKFGRAMSVVLPRQLLSEERTELSMSMLGTRCDRKLQYKASPHLRVKGEPLASATRLKFMYGDLIEALILLLARAAGHTVEGEQDELNINGIIGHRDAIIDGILVDIKSASSMSFAKFRKGLTRDVDDFGYLTQLSSYLFASRDDPLLLDKSRAAFLVIDKQFGHIHLDDHRFNNLQNAEQLVEQKKDLLESRDLAPRAFFDEPEGKSGNRKLGVYCSYCDFKRSCWPGLQIYNYSNGPKFLTRVVRVPDVDRIV